MPRLVFLGPPASGKGTHGRRLSGELSVPHISSGHLIRRSMDRGDPYRVRALVTSGQKVPDEIVEELLAPRLGSGFILDGYPRTARQAERLDALLGRLDLPLHAALELVVDDEALTARLEGRAGAEKRSDDRPDVFARRLSDYRTDIGPLREHYGEHLIQVRGGGQIDEVFDRLLEALRRVRAADQ
jgi:adenylate kinase